jgi:hypothetical protein
MILLPLNHRHICSCQYSLCTYLITSLTYHFLRMYTAANLTRYYLKQFLTRTVWWAVPVIWLPVVCWSISMSIQMGHTLPQIGLMVVFGIFLWTLMEYTLHRFLFHIKTKSYWLVVTLLSLSLSHTHTYTHACVFSLNLKFCIIFWPLHNLSRFNSKCASTNCVKHFL